MACDLQRHRVLAAIVACVVGAGCADVEPPSPWIEQELGTDAVFRDVFFLDDRCGWMVGGAHDIEGGVLASTEDGGATWRFRSGITRPTRLEHNFHLTAVWFFDERNGVIAADGGRILRTIDGGEHWHSVSFGPRVTTRLLDLHFVDERVGWVAGGPVLLRTDDAGRTWRKAGSRDDRPSFSGRAIWFVDRERGVAVGRAGRILRTEDAGSTWIEVRPAVSGEPDLLALSFVDERQGWATGTGGTVLHTADGGATWTRQPVGTILRLTDVAFVDAKRGWVIGSGRRGEASVVFRTRDGGISWMREAVAHSEELHALFMSSDAKHGWAVGKRVRPTVQKLLRYEMLPTLVDVAQTRRTLQTPAP